MDYPLQFEVSVYWLYYARGLLQAKLKHHSDAISAFSACLDAKNYSQLLMNNIELAKEELTNHKQILRTAKVNIAGRSNSAADLSIKASATKLVEKYKQVILFFEQLINNDEDIPPLDFGSIFDIVFYNENQDVRLQYGYAHYQKGLSQAAIDKKKEAVESFNIVNKLLPNFCKPYLQKANIFKEQKSLKKALVQYDAAIRLEYENADLYFARSTLLFELGKTDKAKNDFNRYQQLLSNTDSLRLYDETNV